MNGKVKIIIDLLIKKTKTREMTWERTNNGSYTLNFIGNQIVIDNYITSTRDEKKINFLIYNQNEDLICSILENENRELRELYELVNENYLNINDTMTNIIQALM